MKESYTKAVLFLYFWTRARPMHADIYRPIW